MMNKLFKPKAMRRLLLFMALIFPVVYLCGGLFFALNGAHGQQVFAQDSEVVVSTQVHTLNQFVRDVDDSVDLGSNGSCHYVREGINIRVYGNWDGTPPAQRSFVSYSPKFQHVYLLRLSSSLTDVKIQINDINSSGTAYVRSLTGSSFRFATTVPLSYSGVLTPSCYVNPQSSFNNDVSFSVNLIDLTEWFGVGNEPTIEQFEDMYPSFIDRYVLAEDVIYNVYGVPSYSQFLFNQVFGDDNFVTQLGYSVFAVSRDGFAPVGDLFYIINENILHFDQNDKLAVFGYGYVYYAVNVLIIYEVLILAVKLLMLPLKAVEVFDKEER